MSGMSLPLRRTSRGGVCSGVGGGPGALAGAGLRIGSGRDRSLIGRNEIATVCRRSDANVLLVGPPGSSNWVPGASDRTSGTDGDDADLLSLLVSPAVLQHARTIVGGN